VTAIPADIEDQVSLLGPRFALQFLKASEALTAILAQSGIDRMMAWANLDGEDPARLVAALLKDWTIAIKVLNEYVDAKRSGDQKKIKRVQKRLDKILAPSAHKPTND
jgi:hypothetical protein